MKKIMLLVIVISLVILFGCTSETETTTSLTTAPTTSLDYEAILSDEMNYIKSFLPLEITQDLILPDTSNSRIDVIYYQDETLIEDNTFHYTPSLEGITSILTIELEYHGYVKSEDYSIDLVENESEYNAYLIETTFAEVDRILDEEIPEVIGTDIKIPDISIDNVIVDFEVDTSRIFNGYFIFPFPEDDTEFTMTVTIRFQGIIQIRNLDIVMKGLDSLQRITEIRIVTDESEPVTSKEEYINATFSLISYDANNLPATLMANENIQIRCRGNSTYYMPKLSYRIKFATKTTLLFNHSESDWVLLANFADQTLIRNYLTHNFSSSLNMAFSPGAEFVDLYLNDEYMGNYLLSDQIEVTNDRVDIEEHSTDVDTGYLIEMDKRMYDWPEGTEGYDWFMVYGVPYVIKSPKTDSIYYSFDQFNFIMNYIAEIHLTLMNQEDYSELIDESSFIDWFIVQELFQNVDSGYSSVYLYKDKGDVLKMGPVWDFDLSTGNPGHLEDYLRQPEGWYTSLEFKNIWYFYLMQYDGFRQQLKERWNEIYDYQIQDLLKNVYPAEMSITYSRYMNFQKWDVIGSWVDWYTAPEVYAAKTYEEQVAFLYGFLSTRALWLNEEINKF